MYKCIWTIYVHYRATLNYYFELFESTTTKFRSNALIDWAISYWAIAAPISSFVQCQISFWLLPSLVATFILIEVSSGHHMRLAELTDTYDIHPWRILWSSYRKLDFNPRLLNSVQTLWPTELSDYGFNSNSEPTLYTYSSFMFLFSQTEHRLKGLETLYFTLFL